MLSRCVEHAHTGEKETRAWTIRLGMTAPQAAGVIHTDFEKGFIRAETVAYQDFVEAGGYAEARQRGKLRLEGKEYIVSEADVLVRASPNWRYHMLGSRLLYCAPSRCS